jgi:hypothetical protein
MLLFGLAIMLNMVSSLTRTVSDLENQSVPVINIAQEILPEKIIEAPVQKIIEAPVQKIIEAPVQKISSSRDVIYSYINQVTAMYPNVDSALVKSVIQHESNYKPNDITGKCMGLMQVSTRWHSDRAIKLGVTDFLDPYSNILLGVDYLSELTEQYKDPVLVLMLYNMKHDTAFKLHKEGVISGYAKSVLAKADEYRKGE